MKAPLGFASGGGRRGGEGGGESDGGGTGKQPEQLEEQRLPQRADGGRKRLDVGAVTAVFNSTRSNTFRVKVTLKVTADCAKVG